MSVRVYRRHLYADTPRRQYCSRGSRAFFAARGWDWLDFQRNGIDAQAFIDTGDAMALRAVTHALEEILAASPEALRAAERALEDMARHG